MNVNVLTHLERPRVEYLYNIKNLSFDSAKSQAVKEVLKALEKNADYIAKLKAKYLALYEETLEDDISSLSWLSMIFLI